MAFTPRTIKEEFRGLVRNAKGALVQAFSPEFRSDELGRVMMLWPPEKDGTSNVAQWPVLGTFEKGEFVTGGDKPLLEKVINGFTVEGWELKQREDTPLLIEPGSRGEIETVVSGSLGFINGVEILADQTYTVNIFSQTTGELTSSGPIRGEDLFHLHTAGFRIEFTETPTPIPTPTVTPQNPFIRDRETGEKFFTKEQEGRKVVKIIVRGKRPR